jgi:hypothetical protein
MPDKRYELQPGDCLELGQPEIKPFANKYEFIDIPKEDGKPSKHVIRVKSQDGKIFRVHRTRISKIIKKTGETEQVKDDEATNKTEEKKMDKQDKVEKTEKKAQAKQQQEPTPAHFDLPSWVKEHGGKHFQKESKFDHSNFKLLSHVAIDAEKGFYHTINTYKYPDGTVSLGKNNTGGNKYPLKGKALTVNINVEGDKQKAVRKGKKTAEEIIEQFKKKGYKEVHVKIPATVATTS